MRRAGCAACLCRRAHLEVWAYYSPPLFVSQYHTQPKSKPLTTSSSRRGTRACHSCPVKVCVRTAHFLPSRHDRAPNASGDSPDATGRPVDESGAALAKAACCACTAASSERSLVTSHTIPARSLCRSVKRVSCASCVCCRCFSMVLSLTVTPLRTCTAGGRRASWAGAGRGTGEGVAAARVRAGRARATLA